MAATSSNRKSGCKQNLCKKKKTENVNNYSFSLQSIFTRIERTIIKDKNNSRSLHASNHSLSNPAFRTHNINLLAPMHQFNRYFFYRYKRTYFLVRDLSMLSCDSLSSLTPRYRSLSNRPGLKSAGSRRSGRFVAPMTNTSQAL